MTYPQHWLLAFGGHSGHVDEIWNNGIRLAMQGSEPFSEMDEEQYLTDTALPALTAWLGRTTTHMYNGIRLTWIKFNEIGPDGRYADQTQTHQRLGLNLAPAGSTPTVLHPLQVCMCLSWRTNNAVRGPGSKGRIYSPRPDVAVDVNGDVAGATRVEFAQSAATLLNSLDASIGVPPGRVIRPSIVSAVGSGVANQIDTVVVDSSMDIQRRRSNHQSKEVSSAPVTY